MNVRPYGSKPTITFWLVVAIADTVLLVSAAGVAVALLVVAGAGLAAVGVVLALRRKARRGQSRGRVPAMRFRTVSELVTAPRAGRRGGTARREAPKRRPSATGWHLNDLWEPQNGSAVRGR